jgi:adenosylhomocysteine nucleosidase
MILVCFAVREEARFFKPETVKEPKIQILLTGIGKHNARKVISAVLDAKKPELVLSCGFAGGLNPELTRGSVVFSLEAGTGLEQSLPAAGARQCRFYCSDRIATTADEKQKLWQLTTADAVEMESKIICECCRERKIPSGTVRVILDTANEDLPLDFNETLTADQQMNYAKLGLAVLKSPGKIAGLLRLQRQSREAAEKLGGILNKALKPMGAATAARVSA